MTPWGDRATRLGSALLYPGKPLGNAVTVRPAAVTDSATDIIGMPILRAESMDEAVEMVKGHHHTLRRSHVRGAIGRPSTGSPSAGIASARLSPPHWCSPHSTPEAGEKP